MYILDGDRICRHLSEFQRCSHSFPALLKEAAKNIHESGEQFDWTGIYELLPQNILRLGPFMGTPTPHVRIPVGQGVCGKAVAEARNKIVADVSKEPNYIACSLGTRSEAVILIQKDGRIFGQIDIDSNTLDAFDQQTIEELQKVADWLAQSYVSQPGKEK
jgi:GAF domain-containing protein